MRGPTTPTKLAVKLPPAPRIISAVSTFLMHKVVDGKAKLITFTRNDVSLDMHVFCYCNYIYTSSVYIV